MSSNKDLAQPCVPISCADISSAITWFTTVTFPIPNKYYAPTTRGDAFKNRRSDFLTTFLFKKICSIVVCSGMLGATFCGYFFRDISWPISAGDASNRGWRSNAFVPSPSPCAVYYTVGYTDCHCRASHVFVPQHAAKQGVTHSTGFLWPILLDIYPLPASPWVCPSTFHHSRSSTSTRIFVSLGRAAEQYTDCCTQHKVCCTVSTIIGRAK